MTEEAQFQVKKDLIRKRLLKYTRKAFRMLPKLDEPRILDVGCGAGIPTMELARLSNGQITGLDVNQPSLDRLTRKIKKAGLSDRVKIMKCSMVDMDFPDESFDIIWAEGSIHVVSFKRGLKEWRQFLKPNGFMVVHDEQENASEKLRQISGCGYELLGHFILNEETWWTEYFAPLEKLACEIRTEHPDDPKVLEILHNDQREIETFKKNPKLNSSVFLIVKKR